MNLTKSERSPSIDSRTDLISLQVPFEESDDLFLDAPESPVDGNTVKFKGDQFGIDQVDILEKEEYFDTESVEIVSENITTEIMKQVYSEVEVLHPVVIRELENVLIRKDENLILSCSIENVNEAKWTFNEIDIDETDALMTVNNGEFTMEVSADDVKEGVYAITASNEQASVTSQCNVALDLKVAPRFTRELKFVEVSEKLPVRLECVVEGFPEPNITWFLDDRQLISSDAAVIAYENGVCSLTIAHSRLDDEGDYRCEAVNDIGEANTTAELFVEKYTKSLVENVIFEEIYQIEVELKFKWLNKC